MEDIVAGLIEKHKANSGELYNSCMEEGVERYEKGQFNNSILFFNAAIATMGGDYESSGEISGESRHFLAFSYAWKGDACRGLGNMDGAGELYQKAKVLYEAGLDEEDNPMEKDDRKELIDLVRRGKFDPRFQRAVDAYDNGNYGDSRKEGRSAMNALHTMLGYAGIPLEQSKELGLAVSYFEDTPSEKTGKRVLRDPLSEMAKVDNEEIWLGLEGIRSELYELSRALKESKKLKK
jgi:tetratricopeptide (TPR) repeat protein